MSIQLLITNIGYIISIIFTLSLGLFVFIKNPKEQTNILYLCFIIPWVIYQLSYVIGINIMDPHLSRLAFMFNLSSIFTPILAVHLISSITKSTAKIKNVLATLYSLATLLTIFFIINPDSFLLPSSPKIYYHNFFVLGDLYFIGDIFFYSSILFFLGYIYYSYHKANLVDRSKLKYFFIGFILGCFLASLPAFLLYDINIDPFWSFLAGPMFAIPMAYAIIRYEIIDIKIVAKRALLYALGVGFIMFFFIIINSVNDNISKQFPLIPIWVVPLLSSFIAVSIGVFVWKKIKEVDVLKYEFINIIMHKFRTPLTAVKWSLDTLTDPTLTHQSEPEKKAIENIKTANLKLINLTNIVASLTFLENREYQYNLEKADITEIIQNIRDELSFRIEEKKLEMSYDYDKDLPKINLDIQKIKFAIQTLLDNAVNYSKAGEKIIISIKKDKEMIYLTVKDSGIGIPKEDPSHIFAKFFRSQGAQNADTEGMGIGLHLTKDIVNRHGGKISAESEGVGKGATFTIQLPIGK